MAGVMCQKHPLQKNTPLRSVFCIMRKGLLSFFASCRSDSLYRAKMTPVMQKTQPLPSVQNVLRTDFRIGIILYAGECLLRTSNAKTHSGVGFIFAMSSSGALHHVKSTLCKNYSSIFRIMRKRTPDQSFFSFLFCVVQNRLTSCVTGNYSCDVCLFGVEKLLNRKL